MSEYQYYEFQAIDKALSAEEQKEIAKISSRVKLSTRSAAFTYNYSDLKADPKELLLKFFDVYFYISNFGVMRLMFKFPKDLVDIEALKSYSIEYYLTVEIKEEFVILNLNHVDEEYGGDWVDGEDWLAPLLCLRDDILSGDYRSLYIAWLAIALITNLDKDTLEPPVPTGLDKLSPALETLIELYELDRYIVKAASQASSGSEDKVLTDVERLKLIKKIPKDEINEFLINLSNTPQRRSLKDICSIAKQLESESQVKQKLAKV